jgi:hypothetical protein
VRDPRFKEQNFKSCVEYYNRIFKPLRKSVPKEHLDGLFSQVLIDQAPSMVGIVPEMTMNQFLDLLESANKPSENTV